MIAVDISYIPYGCSRYEKPMYHLMIANDATGTEEVGNYLYRMLDPVDGHTVYTGHVEGHHRQNDDICFLLKRVLDDMATKLNWNIDGNISKPASTSTRRKRSKCNADGQNPSGKADSK